MAAEREYKYTLKDRATYFWHTIHKPDYWIDIPVTKDTVNKQGFHSGDVVGYPSYHVDEPVVVLPARIILDARKSGSVYTSLDLGYSILGGKEPNLQRVLPGMEEEISLAVDEVRKRSKEREKRGPDPDTDWGRW